MKTFISLCLVCFILTSTSNLFAQAGWIVTQPGKSQQMVSGTAYYLKDVEHNWHLRYEERDFGINLGWDKESTPNIKFVKKGGGKINCGDKVAIYVESNDSEHYIKYESRRWGINLVWSKEPVYEWEVRNEANEKGTPVMTNKKIGLYSSIEKDFMIYCTRSTPTINLGWSKDCEGGYRLPGSANKVKSYLPYVEKVIKYGAPLL
jgi:hypothetical protein